MTSPVLGFQVIDTSSNAPKTIPQKSVHFVNETRPSFGVAMPIEDDTKFNQPKIKPQVFGEVNTNAVSAADFNKLLKQFNDLKTRFNLTENTEPDKTDLVGKTGLTQKEIDEFYDQAEDEKLHPIKLIRKDPPFYVLCELTGVPDPLNYDESNPVLLTPASEGWFQCLDKMRCQGWPLEGPMGIRWFLRKTAEVIRNDLGFECSIYKENAGTPSEKAVAKAFMHDPKKKMKQAQSIAEEKKYQNFAEYFCLWYPSASKHEALFKKGLTRLMNDIRDQNQDAMLPENYEKLMQGVEDEVCPPKKFDFRFNNGNSGGATMENFLRHFTEWSKDNPTYIRSDAFGGVTNTYECKPPPGMKYSWIPAEYLQNAEFVNFYNLHRYRYMNAADFQNLLYNIIRPIDISSINPTRQLQGVGNLNVPGSASGDQDIYMDEHSASIIRDTEISAGKEHPFIAIKGNDKKSYKVFFGELELSFPPGCEEEEADKKETLRGWCNLLEPDNPEKFISRYYPLMYVILNSAPPKNSNYKTNINKYIYTLNSQKGTVQRMYSNAPLSAFQASLIEKYLYGVNKMDTHEQCLTKFINRIYQECVLSTLIQFDDFDPTIVPDDYKRVLTKLFEYGGNEGCSLKEVKEAEKENVSESINNPVKEEPFDIKEMLIEREWDKQPALSTMAMYKKFRNYVGPNISANFKHNKEAGLM